MGCSVLVSQTANRCINLQQLLVCPLLRIPKQIPLNQQETDDQALPYYSGPHA
jgi:hypothetical protein